MDDCKAYVGFIFKEGGCPKISMKYDIFDNDAITIYDFYDYCRGFARAIGYAEQNIEEVFDKEF